MMLKREEEEARTAAKAPAPPAPKPKFYAYRPCLCGCGERVGQVRGAKAKHYLSTEHYEAHRALQRRSMGMRTAPADADGVNEPQKRRLVEEVAPIVAKEKEIERAVEAVRTLTGDASYALWGACLGVVL